MKGEGREEVAQGVEFKVRSQAILCFGLLIEERRSEGIPRGAGLRLENGLSRADEGQCTRIVWNDGYSSTIRLRKQQGRGVAPCPCVDCILNRYCGCQSRSLWFRERPYLPAIYVGYGLVV